MVDSHTERLVWWNGELIPESEARVSIYDSALMFGDTVFEMMRSFNKKVFKLREHLERLYASAKYVRNDMANTIGEMEWFVEQTIQANEKVGVFREDDEYRVLINVTRGLLSIYEDVIGVEKGPNVIIAIFPLRWTVRGMGKLFDTGVNLVIPSQRQIPSYLLESKVKNRSRLHYLMANIEASQIKGENNWPLLLDPDGFVTEGPGYNFFIVKYKTATTPSYDVLKGISRKYIFELNDSAYFGAEFYEGNIEPYDIYNTGEAFITATPFCMLPVTSLNGLKIGDGKSEPVFERLLAKWSDNVGLDIKAQIQKWDAESSEIKIGVSPYEFKRTYHT